MSPIDGHGNYYPPSRPRPDAGLESDERTTTGTSDPFDVHQAAALEAILTISEVSGSSPTLDLALETTVDGTNWYVVAAFPQQVGTGSDGRVFGPLGRKARWKWTIGGSSPAFTFEVAVSAKH